jgi:hypothetical protein
MVKIIKCERCGENKTVIRNPKVRKQTIENGKLIHWMVSMYRNLCPSCLERAVNTHDRGYNLRGE